MRHVIKNWEFNGEKWAKVIAHAYAGIGDDLGPLLDVSEGTIRRWANSDYLGRSFPYPTMTNLIKVCSLLDLDPREFFVLEYDPFMHPPV